MRVAIIGAGPSGLTCAICLKKKGIDVVVYERLSNIGNKLRATGNGKANLSNEHLIGKYYNNEAFANDVISKFGIDELKKYFGDLGIALTIDDEGRVYPLHLRANQVADILRLETIHLNVKIVNSHRVMSIVFDKMWEVDKELFDYVVFATGGKSYPNLGSDGSGIELLADLGHSVVPMIPALCPLKCQEDVSSLAGVRARVVVNAHCFSQAGEMLFREDALSGIVIFSLSRMFRDFEKHCITVDFLPSFSNNDLKAFVEMMVQNQGWKYLDSFFNGLVDEKIAFYVLQQSGIKYKGRLASSLTALECERLLMLFKAMPFNVFNGNDFTQSQVTMGGIDLKDVGHNFKSRIKDNLYIVGECLDIDGDTGGYNLHMAFASGYLAAQDVIKCLK